MERDIKYIATIKKWFDKVNGNTYHSARILRVRDDKEIKVKWQYGYEEQYKQSCFKEMQEQEWIVKFDNYSVNYWQRKNNYPIKWIDKGHGLKRDMIAWGGE